MEENVEQGFPPAQQTPPGWYKDPTTGNDRYWDGTQWTQQEVKKSNVGGVEIAGYITSVLFWPAGLILGIISTARGTMPHGPVIIGISIIFAVIGVLYVTSMS